MRPRVQRMSAKGGFFVDQSYHFQTLRVMNDVPSDGADTGEVLETIKHVRSGDAQGWWPGRTLATESRYWRPQPPIGSQRAARYCTRTTTIAQRNSFFPRRRQAACVGGQEHSIVLCRTRYAGRRLSADQSALWLGTP